MMAEGKIIDVAVKKTNHSHPLDLKLLCLSQLRDLKDRIIKIGI
jgi:hypothetical protein